MKECFRVVMVAACPYPTTQGTQVYIRGLSRALVEAGHEVHIVTYHFGEDLPPCGAVVHRISGPASYSKLRAGPAWGKPLLDFLLLVELLRVVREVRPDLVHVHNYEAPVAGYIARRLTGIPVLYNSHNFMVDELHTYFEGRVARGLARRLARFLDEQVPRRADSCIAISPEALPLLERLGVPPERLHYIPPGLHADEFPRSLSSEATECTAPRIVYAGNPDRYQDLDLLLRAMLPVREQLPEARLRIVSGADLSEVVTLAREIGVPMEALELVTTSDWPSVCRAIVEARVAALPRVLCRGFPIKLLNYMALGMPVVACAGSAKFLRNGTEGRVVAPEEGAFADALVDLLENPKAASRMGRAARTSVLNEHLWSRRVPAIERAYASMLASP
ncbi:MAG: glycosyltransferase family 4 protein [Myxococcota bacterium]|nr:glycosyltransferase family 4 protein [Myxococcota bacterium]